MMVFLDDERFPHQCATYMYKRIGLQACLYTRQWTIAKDFEQFINIIRDNADIITHISFDHDLADEHTRYTYPIQGLEFEDLTFVELQNYELIAAEFDEKTGYDCAKWMKEYYEELKLNFPILYVHSMNPIGVENIINVFLK